MASPETSRSTRWGAPGSVVAGLVAAIGASACCAGPLLLVVLGVGGAWGSRLVALEPLQPLFVVAALAFFGLAFRRLYPRQEACTPDAVCARPAVWRGGRVIFWIVSAFAALLISFPLYAPLLY